MPHLIQIDSRAFTLDDQRRFAGLSRDENPIHVDPVAARRTMFGGVVVHGMHALLWGLDRALARRPWCGPLVIEQLAVRFRQAIRLQREVRLLEGKTDDLQLALQLDGVTACSIRAGFVTGTSPADIPGRWVGPPRPPSQLDFAAARLSCGVVPLVYDRTVAASLFPTLSSRLDAGCFAELLASTYIVGMLCPGLRSLFAGLELRRRTGGPTRSDLAYRVAHSDDRFSCLELAVEGPATEGRLTAFLRPSPQVQPDLSAIESRVAAGVYANQRALIVGGSRGLGEATAKCIAAGGGMVAMTYHLGRSEAESIAEEIVTRGGRALAVAFDCTAPPADLRDRIASLCPITHLYYCATPRISVDTARFFSADLFRELCRHHVEGLARTVAAVHAITDGDLLVIYPSTAFLDEPIRGAAEYIAAKAAGEAVCRQLGAILPNTRVVCPRLPRMRTDQTAGLLAADLAEPVDVALDLLNSLGALAEA